MTKLIVLPDKKYDDMECILNSGMVLFVKESTLNEFCDTNGVEPNKAKEIIQDKYTCGGDPDVWVDFCDEENDFALYWALEQSEGTE